MTRGLPLLLLLAGCVASNGGKPPPKATAARQPEIIFSHAKHQEQEVPCETCHAGTAASTALDRRHSPKMAVCGECHDVEEQSGCKKCHRNPEEPGELPRAPSTKHLVFSHAAHVKRAKDCLACHAGAVVARDLAEVPRPRMRADCFDCHNHMGDYRALRCKGCHESLSRYPIRFVSQFNHEGNFLGEHGRQARGNSDLCATCHGQSFCADCHAGQRATVLPSVKRAEEVGRQFIHRGDWLGQHALRSRAEPGQCIRCHSPKSCDSCHRARGVSVTSGSTGRSPHPADWLSPGSPNSHGREARRRITQCAGCHDRGAASNCIRCHRSAAKGGLGLNPHPPGWSRGGKDSDQVCQLCH
jgi:hypothetical protein